MTRTPFTDGIEDRLIDTEDGPIWDTEDTKRALGLLRGIEGMACGNGKWFDLRGVIEAFRNGTGDSHLQGRLLDAVLFPSRQELK